MANAIMDNRQFGWQDTWPVQLVRNAIAAFALPGQVAGGQMAVRPTVPGMWSEEDEYNQQRAANTIESRAKDLAGTLMMGGVAGAQPGAAGIFGGRLAATADQAALRKAEEMAAKGAGRDQIWNDTGWFQGADGKWRFEIDDSGTSFFKGAMKPVEYNILGNKITALTGEAGRALAHDRLFAAYPDAARFATVQGRSSGDFKGQFSPPVRPGDRPSIALDFDQLPTVGDMRSTMLHELQHGIQHMEGFAPGTNSKVAPKNVPNPAVAQYDKALKENPLLQEYHKVHGSSKYATELAAQNERWKELYSPRLDKIYDLPREQYDPKLVDAIFAEAKADFAKRYPTMARLDSLFEELKAVGIPTRRPAEFLDPQTVYARTAGEVEARNVQSRMDMTPNQRRATPPWKTQDVADDLQIIRSDPAQSSFMTDMLKLVGYP